MRSTRAGWWSVSWEWVRSARYILPLQPHMKLTHGLQLTRDKLQAFGMKILYHNRHRLPAEEEQGAEYVSFDELLEKSQCIVLHCSLNKDNYHKFGDKEFAKMRKGSYIVNVSRGAGAYILLLSTIFYSPCPSTH